MVKIIKTTSVRIVEGAPEIRALIYADSKSEITDSMSVSTIVGMPANATLSPFSIAVTPDFDIACLNSSGKWTWK